MNNANISRYDYNYDARGVRTALQEQIEQDPVKTLQFSYDPSNQLAGEQVTSGKVGETYTSNIQNVFTIILKQAHYKYIENSMSKAKKIFFTVVLCSIYMVVYYVGAIWREQNPSNHIGVSVRILLAPLLVVLIISIWRRKDIS